jgi:hypothetical protein
MTLKCGLVKFRTALRNAAKSAFVPTHLGNIRPDRRSRRTHPKGERAMTAKAKALDQLFHDTLKDIYFAEK